MLSIPKADRYLRTESGSATKLGRVFNHVMACWLPSPWWPYPQMVQPESPHQAAIAKNPEPKKRKPRTRKPIPVESTE